jgi:glycosyltransferase involved in cell wall biosynthesis
MRILMVSIFAPHFFNWTEQLKDSGHEVYWLDINDSNTHIEKIDFAKQIIGWRYKWNYPCRYFIKKNLPDLTNFLNRWNERDFQDFFEQKIKEIKPHAIHSFVMYLSTARITEVMKKYPSIKWIYSSWGSDLFYYQHLQKERERMRTAFPNIHYMFSDCQRDHQLAVNYGFKGQYLGAFPGGGGYDFLEIESFIKPTKERNTILIKGYQGLHGRCIEILRAMETMEDALSSYQIVVFGANPDVFKYIANTNLNEWKNLKVLGTITNLEVLKLMGSARLYIGNSTSDGMPNTLLEAIIMGAFPIQSNPGGATSEKIIDGFNGLLIEEPEDITELRKIILKGISPDLNILKAVTFNFTKRKPQLERNYIQKQILLQYSRVEEQIKNEISNG